MDRDAYRILFKIKYIKGIKNVKADVLNRILKLQSNKNLLEVVL